MSEEKHTPPSDTIHNLNVVREALEAEGLTVHVKLIDQAIEDISSPPQAVQLPPIPIHWARPNGDTFDEMRDNVWKTGLATVGDTILIWVNEGDFLHAQIVFGAVEYPQISRNTQAGSAPLDERPYCDPIEQGKAFYLSMYEKKGALWRANENQDVWVELARDYERRRAEVTALSRPERRECRWSQCDQPSGHDFCYKHCVDQAPAKVGHPLSSQDRVTVSSAKETWE